ncbi:MAG: ATP-binding protein, partial [Spirochaetales bacterium]|nr:ATP-binding protein [Spirochaetales bacterium]
MASITNPLKITNTFNANTKEKVSIETIGKYLGLFEEAFLTKKVRRYDVEGRKYINASFKFYFEDIGIRNARLGFRQINDTHIMENIIFNELRCRGFNVDIGTVTCNEKTDRLNKNGKPIYVEKTYEVDFVATKGSEKYYIQSAYSIPDEAKEAQEKNSLLKIDDSFRKLIIVHDDIKLRRDDKGIVTMNVYDFLEDLGSLKV